MQESPRFSLVMLEPFSQIHRLLVASHMMTTTRMLDKKFVICKIFEDIPINMSNIFREIVFNCNFLSQPATFTLVSLVALETKLEVG